MLWEKEAFRPTRTATELRDHLVGRFLLVTRDEFESQIEQHRVRIGASASSLAPGARETWLDFEFHPAIGPERLRAVAAELQTLVEADIRDGVECLILLLAHVQLRIYTTLLLGRHNETGQALAAHNGIMRAALDYYAPAGNRAGALTAENRDRLMDMLQAHLDMSRAAGRTLAALGKSHEFESIFATAAAAFDATSDATNTAVARFLATRGAA